MSVYACSDLHGMGELWDQIKKFIKPEDKLYFLGDAADRGSDGWRIFKELYNDDRVIYIKGNHEDMLAKAILEYHKYDGQYCKDLRLLCSNGGERTFQDWIADGAYIEWMREINNISIMETYVNKQGIKIYLSHAGFTPWRDVEIFPSNYSLIWDRDHYLEEPEDSELFGISIHGHTPQLYIAEDLRINNLEKGALLYCNNHKICLDTAAFYTKYTVLLDLDTFDEHIFEI